MAPVAVTTHSSGDNTYTLVILGIVFGLFVALSIVVQLGGPTRLPRAWLRRRRKPPKAVR